MASRPDDFLRRNADKRASKDSRMLNFKILLHVYLPVTAVFILNNLVLWTLETPGHLIVNILTYGVVVSISILCLRTLQDKKPESKPQNAEKIEVIYDDLKKLLANTCTKESLPTAKELARICSELGPIAAGMNDEVKKEGPFGNGSLRSAYGYQSKKAA